MSDTGRKRKILLNGGADLPQEQEELQLPTDVSEGSVQTGSTSKPQKIKPDPNKPICCGVTKNIREDKEFNKGLIKWMQTLFTGVPYPMDGDMTLFQVFPNDGSTVNSMGYACDQVIVYGRLKNGMISAGNDVEIYGYRDADNNVVASRVYNRATGASIFPKRVLSATVIWVITVLLLALAAALYAVIGWQGILAVLVIFFIITHMGTILKWLLFFATLKFLFGRRR